MARSIDSGSRPFNHVRYESANTNPYGAGDPYYNNSTGYLPPQPPKKAVSGWIKFGVPVAILIVIGVAVGVAVGIVEHNKHNNSNSDIASNPSAAASSAINAKSSVGRFPTATDASFFMPIYPSTVCLSLRFDSPLALTTILD